MKLKKQNINFKVDETWHNFEFDINVNKSGLFTTTIKPEDAQMLIDGGISLDNNRLGNPGYFESITIDGLVKDVKFVFENYFTGEIVESKIVIQYQIQAAASYMWTKDQKIIPNGGWTIDGEIDDEKGWCRGNTISGSPDPFGILVYFDIKHKVVTRYKNGQEKTEYKHESYIPENMRPDDYFFDYMVGIRSMGPIMRSFSRSKKVFEMDYTLQRAQFFVQIFKGICRMVDQVTGFIESDDMLEMIDSGDFKLLNQG